MKIADTVAPSYEQLRPLKPIITDTFPVYSKLVHTLNTAQKHADDTVAHVLGTCSAYAYSDGDTVAMIMARLGLNDNHCLRVEQSVDAMFIRSTAYLLQSKCGRVVILCYRGTEPVNVVNWLTDADVSPEKVTFDLPGENDSFEVHGGFYRNVRATRHEVLNALVRAYNGRSVLQTNAAVEHPMESLYITGHSLGGAMAAMFGLMLVSEPAYAPIVEKLKAIYTFGQPMIGDSGLAKACSAHPFLGPNVLRYVYGNDVVPELPPKASGDFAHFGVEHHFERRGENGQDGHWTRRANPSTQLGNVLELSGAAFAFLAQQVKTLRNFPFQHSIYDHGPQHYISALTPPGVRSEFGD